MKYLNRIGDRILNRFVPEQTAIAADCWVEPCPNCACAYPCYRTCCASTGCSSVCFC